MLRALSSDPRHAFGTAHAVGMNVLVFNLGMDAEHSELGHTTAWVNELARRCDHVSVITMFAGQLAVEDNVTVHSLGKELGRSEPRRLVEFYRLARQVVRERRIDACFAHMAPLFTVLFAPVARRHRIPVLLWYAHPTVTPTLRVAHALADRCVTASRESFPLPSNKLHVVGHGIDTQRFTTPADVDGSYKDTALAVGRITPRKHLDEMVEAVALLEREHDQTVRLELLGGPSTAADHEYGARLKRSVTALGVEHLVRFRGPVPFPDIPSNYHRGMLSLNSSDTALDKAILESMASGCIPVSRNPAFQALANVHGFDWLVPAPGPSGLADCIRRALERGRDERDSLVAELRGIVVDEHSLSTLSDRLVAHLGDLAGRTGAEPTMSHGGSDIDGRRPRVLFVGDSDFDLPLPPSLERKWDAVARQLDVRVIGRAHAVRSEDPRFRLVPQAPRPFRGLGHYVALPVVVGRELRSFRPEAIVAKSPFEAFALLPARSMARNRPRLIVELHGDWRTAARLYGSPLRRLYALLADRAAVFALRRADGVRAVSGFTASLAERATGRRTTSIFPAYFDLQSFASEPPRPLPVRPAVAWIGVLERYKNPGVLAEAWRLAAPRLDGARLVVVGRGPLQPIVDDLVHEFPQRVTSIPRLTPPEVAKLLDESTLLALSSESEGYPRVIMEAFARGRPVVATRAGGIPDIVQSGRNGLLVDRGDLRGFADALVRVISDRELAKRLARAALEDAEQLRWTPDRYAQALRRLVDSLLLGA
jgi:glycosyltransferase involved in cell wall biosynthesis